MAVHPAAWPALPRGSEALPVLRWLPELAACAAAETAAVVAALVAAAPDLRWRQSYGAAIPPPFRDRYGWTELIGPNGLWAGDTHAAGFLMLGPDTLYPSHRHAAEEIYWVLAGTAGWQRGGGAFMPVAPGGLVHHASWQPHAMRTGGQPLLAFYVWHGSLAEAAELV